MNQLTKSMQLKPVKKPFIDDLKLLCVGCSLVVSPIPSLAIVASFFLHIPAVLSQVNSSNSVAQIAERITVRVEGATQGSGILVHKNGEIYTIITAWHVVSSNSPGEEIDIYTSDDLSHRVLARSVRRLGDKDLAVMSFRSNSYYDLARIGNVKSSSLGSSVYVSGFPLISQVVPFRTLRFLKGLVVSKLSRPAPDGYGFLYSNATIPGMSGGGVFNTSGELIAIHGRGETDISLTEQEGVAVKTQTNMGMPLSDSLIAAIRSFGSVALKETPNPVVVKRKSERFMGGISIINSPNTKKIVGQPLLSKIFLFIEELDQAWFAMLARRVLRFPKWLALLLQPMSNS